MHFENPITFVRAIRGAPASILWAMYFTKRAMTALELQEWTGYKGDNITVAVRLLVNLGWINARSPRGPWCLCDGRQFPLMDTESDLIGVSDSVVVDVESKLNVPTITTTTTTNTTPIKSDSSTESENFRLKNITALRELGIVGSRPNKVAALEWVTPKYIQAHVAAARKNPGIDNPEGFALTQMEYQAPEPASLNKSQVKTNNQYSSHDAKIQSLRNRAQEDDEDE